MKRSYFSHHIWPKGTDLIIGQLIIACLGDERLMQKTHA